MLVSISSMKVGVTPAYSSIHLISMFDLLPGLDSFLQRAEHEELELQHKVSQAEFSLYAIPKFETGKLFNIIIIDEQDVDFLQNNPDAFKQAVEYHLQQAAVYLTLTCGDVDVSMGKVVTKDTTVFALTFAIPVQEEKELANLREIPRFPAPRPIVLKDNKTLFLSADTIMDMELADIQALYLACTGMVLPSSPKVHERYAQALDAQVNGVRIGDMVAEYISPFIDVRYLERK